MNHGVVVSKCTLRIYAYLYFLIICIDCSTCARCTSCLSVVRFFLSTSCVSRSRLNCNVLITLTFLVKAPHNLFTDMDFSCINFRFVKLLGHNGPKHASNEMSGRSRSVGCQSFSSVRPLALKKTAKNESQRKIRKMKSQSCLSHAGGVVSVSRVYRKTYQLDIY